MSERHRRAQILFVAPHVVAKRSGGDPEMSTLITWLSAAVRRDEEGQGLAEYALILALIAIVVIGAVIFLGGQINTIMSNVGQSI